MTKTKIWADRRQSANLDTGQLKLFSLRNKEKNEGKWTEPKGPMSHDQVDHMH